MNQEKLYKKHYYQIEKIVNQLCSKFSIFSEKEDIRAQANLIFCLSVKKYNPEKSAFSTYLHYEIYWRLFTYIKKKIEIRDNEMDEIIFQDSKKKISNLFFSLSKEAKEVINILFNLPDELLQLHPQKKVTVGTLQQFFRSKGWLIKTIHSIFNEIKGVLR